MSPTDDPSASVPPISVGIAVVEHCGCYLVGFREDAVPLAGYAEFPGGKCHAGESPAECAVRECREETGLAVVATERLLHSVHDYAHGRVDLHFWHCFPESPGDATRNLRGFRWIPASELASLRFPEANEPLIARLAQRGASSDKE